jgi:hypothetical protein
MSLKIILLNFFVLNVAGLGDVTETVGFVLLQSHAACHKQITGECTFGNLEPIYLPPHAVSIPRTEVPMEAIIGVQVRRRETMSREYSCRKCCFSLTSRWHV